MCADNLVFVEMIPSDWTEVIQFWQCNSNICLSDSLLSPDRFSEVLAGNSGLSYVAREKINQKIVAALLCTTDGIEVFFRHAFVEEKYRRQGVMRRLIGAVTDSMRRNYSLRRCLAFVLDGNISGMRAFASYGWQKKIESSCYEPDADKGNRDCDWGAENYTVREITQGDLEPLMVFWEKKFCGSDADYLADRRILEKYLIKNSGMSSLVTDRSSGKIAGSLLAGSDGIYGSLRNLAVMDGVPAENICRLLTGFSCEKLRSRGICDIYALAYDCTENTASLWNESGWQEKHGFTFFQNVV